ncbi:DUF3785 domain-containing protein [Clostridium malenominatum]|uniref:DUF3785 domain-containing protein n=1 Tax=Clostridium malenominatum TaxID=1539 RepID=A0ABN1J080_9CLOT
MDNYKFIFKDKEYNLSSENCDFIFLDDEENEITGIDLGKIRRLLNESNKVEFDLSYYKEPCMECKNGIAEKLKHFRFLEYSFYIFTKNNEYVISNISKEFEHTNFTQLLREGKVDNSYVLMIIVCESCGTYSIEIEQCDM